MLELWSDNIFVKFYQPGALNKNPTVWLGGARPSPEYLIVQSTVSCNWVLT